MNYYISPLGDDRNSGTSPEEAWKTIGRVNEGKWASGDKILFQGNRTFTGTLRLENVSADGAAVTIGSYGEGLAILDGREGSAIVVIGCKRVSISNVRLTGMGRKTGNRQGAGVHLINSIWITVERVETTGFQRAGVVVEGCSDIRLVGVHAHNNGYAGITTEGARNHNLYIGYCSAINNPGDPTITNNHSGSGIVLFNVQNALVEYCEAADNGWDMQQENSNGPVGMWTACGADRVVIQYCISHNNKSPQRDGGGFDFDGGTTNSIMQYNYSYDNNGCGYLLCQYFGGDPVENNVIRYCVSENDGQGDHGCGIYTYLADGSISGCDVYHNVVYNQDGRGAVIGAMPDSRYRNNIFILQGSGTHVKDAENGLFQDNCYWRTDGGPIRVEGFTDLEAWRAATGNEKMGETPTGFYGDPGLVRPGGGERMTDPTKLNELTAYQLRGDSPLRRMGLNLRKLFGIDAGGEDFFGNPLPEDGGVTPGIHQSPEITVSISPLLLNIPSRFADK